MQQFAIKSQRYCDLGFQKGKTYHKMYKRYTKLVPGGPKAPKQLHNKNLYKTIVKVHTARTLCTHIQATSVFQTQYQKGVQSIPLWGHNFDFRSGLAIGVESITKPKREAQNG